MSPRPARAPRWRLLRDLVAAVALYYVLPLGADVADPVLWIRLAVVVVGLALVTVSIVRRIRAQLRADRTDAEVEGLAVAVVVGVLVSAAADYVVATAMPGQFVDLVTRTDALYFALTTLTTVGYGDVHAAGQVARGLVVAQMLINAVVLVSGVGVVARTLRERLGPGG